MTDLISQSIIDEAVCRTPPATPRLLKNTYPFMVSQHQKYPYFSRMGQEYRRIVCYTPPPARIRKMCY